MPQIYPAPYSQSWAGIGQSKRSFIEDKHPSKTSNGYDNISKKHSSRTSTSHSFVSQQRFSPGLDPTVPHLKYGLFPKKMYMTRGQSRIFTIKPSTRPTSQETGRRGGSPKTPRCITEPRRLKVERPAIAKASTVQKFLHPQKPQGETDGPVFVFRPLEHRNLRSLSMSASTHLDIKPRPMRGLVPSQTPLFM